MAELLASFSLLLTLLNPFLLVVYLIQPMKSLDRAQFRWVLLRAGLIAGAVFCCFAILGDAIFSRLIQAEFASFQIFGGLVVLLVALQFVFQGPSAIEMLRGEPGQVAGAVAMPVLIGPGTLSASIIIGERLDPARACAAVTAAVAASLLIVLALKSVHDYVRPRNEPLVERYFAVAGRITALYFGTVAVEMIAVGLRTWLAKP